MSEYDGSYCVCVQVITQQSQGQAIQLAQVPTVAKLPAQQQATVVPVTVTVASTPTRTSKFTNTSTL